MNWNCKSPLPCLLKFFKFLDWEGVSASYLLKLELAAPKSIINESCKNIFKYKCLWNYFDRLYVILVSKCSATLASVATPPRGARQGLNSEVQATRDTPGRWQCYAFLPRAKRSAIGAFGMGCDRALWGGGGGCVAATALRHIQYCGKSRDRGVATPWSATGGGVVSAPLSMLGLYLLSSDKCMPGCCSILQLHAASRPSGLSP